MSVMGKHDRAIKILSLRRPQRPVKIRARRTLLAAAGLALLALAWHQFVAPYLLRLPSNFSYEASVISHDNFYNEQSAGYSGIAVSDTKFSYSTVASRDGVLDIKNLFDVRTTSGEKIFAVERAYGIDRRTRMHVPGRGDRERTGYLFGPQNLTKQDFTYWHINYDMPAVMKFQTEEELLGLTVYHYTADYHADQTKNLTHLPGVGTSRGINLDINLQLWIEPETGYLVKYEDDTTAYYYDLATGERLNPWNQFSNRYSFDSIAEHVQKAERSKQRKAFVETSIPVLFGCISFVLLVRWGIVLGRDKGRRTRPPFVLSRICALAVGGTAIAVIFGWIVNNPLLTRLHPAFSAMHILTAVNFLLIALALWLLMREELSSRVQLAVRLLLGAVMVSTALSFAYNIIGFGGAAGALLARPGLPSIANISPVTSICFVLISVTLWVDRSSGRIVNLAAQVLLSEVAVLATVAISGYAFSLSYLYSLGGFRTMALHTAILFLLVTFGMFARHREWYLTRLVRKFSKSVMLALMVLALLLSLAGLSWQQSIATVTKQADIQFQSDANDLQLSIDHELSGYIKALQGARGLFAASREVDRREWKAYVDGLGLTQNYPGVQGVGFAQMIPSAQKAAHIASVQGEGYPAYTIHPEGTRAAYSSVVYLEPFNKRNQQAFGYDMLTDATRRAALERARDTGQPAMSGKVTLAQETDTDPQAGLLLYLPVYQNGAGLTSIKQRRAALVGYVYMPIRMTDFMRATVGERTHGLNIGVFASADPEHLTLQDRLYSANPQYGIENPAYKPEFVRVEALPIAGQTLMLRYASLPSYDPGAVQNLPALVLMSGVLLSLLLAALTFLLSSSRNRALKLANAMTIDLRAERNRAITNQRKDEAILISIGDGVFVVDQTGSITLFNKAAESISGFAASEAIGQPYQKVLSFYHEEDGRPADDFIAAAQSGKSAEMAANTMLRRKNGTSLPVADSAAPILNAKGTLEGAVVVFRDTTREKQLENMKDEFLSVASHELRTPMGAIRANLSMILAGDYGTVNKELVEPLADMKTSTVRLVELVNDLLDVARIEAGRMKFTLSDFDIQEVLRSTVSSLAPLGKEKGIQITHAHGNAAVVQADTNKIKQVLTNLVGNALKFTDKGSITVTASPQKDMIEVVVSDTGIGMTPEDQKKLFNKFNQITSAQEGKPAGTGLGLYISREIIRKLGGELWIKASAAGQGSAFAFTLPRAQTPAARETRRHIEQEASLHSDQK